MNYHFGHLTQFEQNYSRNRSSSRSSSKTSPNKKIKKIEIKSCNHFDCEWNNINLNKQKKRIDEKEEKDLRHLKEEIKNHPRIIS